MRHAWTLLAVATVGGVAAADEVVLKNGFTLQGIVTETENRVTVELPSGSISLPREQVKEIVRDEEGIQEFEERRRSAATADEHYQLARWAAERGLKERAESQYRRVIALDPNHKEARRHLGYVEHEGRWLREDDFMALKGFVRHEGRWVPWDVYTNLRKAEMDARLQQERETLVRSILSDEEQARPQRWQEGGAADGVDRAMEPRRTAPWNWGVRGTR